MWDMHNSKSKKVEKEIGKRWGTKNIDVFYFRGVLWCSGKGGGGGALEVPDQDGLMSSRAVGLLTLNLNRIRARLGLGILRCWFDNLTHIIALILSIWVCDGVQ